MVKDKEDVSALAAAVLEGNQSMPRAALAKNMGDRHSMPVPFEVTVTFLSPFYSIFLFFVSECGFICYNFDQ